MNLCRIHNHSSEKTAAECYISMAGRRADRKLRRSGAAYTRKRVQMLRHSPPRVVVRQGVQYFIFGEDVAMQYL